MGIHVSDNQKRRQQVYDLAYVLEFLDQRRLKVDSEHAARQANDRAASAAQRWIPGGQQEG